MHTVISSDQVGNAVQGIDYLILSTWTRIPALRCRIGVRVEFANHHRTRHKGWGTQVKLSLLAWRLSLHRDCPGSRVHENPASLLVTLSWVGELGIAPGLLDRLLHQIGRASRRERGEISVVAASLTKTTQRSA